MEYHVRNLATQKITINFSSYINAVQRIGVSSLFSFREASCPLFWISEFCLHAYLATLKCQQNLMSSEKMITHEDAVKALKVVEKYCDYSLDAISEELKETKDENHRRHLLDESNRINQFKQHITGTTSPLLNSIQYRLKK